jgi:drug/metabolite transporter (DMT)-like permease
LIGVESLGFLGLVFIPILIWLLNDTRFVNTLFPKTMFVVCIIIGAAGTINGCYVLWNYLMKIDFSKSINDNIHYVNKYSIFYRKMKMAGYLVIFPIMFLLSILSYYELKATFHMWLFLIVTIVIAIGVTIWMYKSVYEKNIQSIKESLAELSELEEE